MASKATWFSRLRPARRTAETGRCGADDALCLLTEDDASDFQGADDEVAMMKKEKGSIGSYAKQGMDYPLLSPTFSSSAENSPQGERRTSTFGSSPIENSRQAYSSSLIDGEENWLGARRVIRAPSPLSLPINDDVGTNSAVLNTIDPYPSTLLNRDSTGQGDFGPDVFDLRSSPQRDRQRASPAESTVSSEASSGIVELSKYSRGVVSATETDEMAHSREGTLNDGAPLLISKETAVTPTRKNNESTNTAANRFRSSPPTQSSAHRELSMTPMTKVIETNGTTPSTPKKSQLFTNQASDFNPTPHRSPVRGSKPLELRKHSKGKVSKARSAASIDSSIDEDDCMFDCKMSQWINICTNFFVDGMDDPKTKTTRRRNRPAKVAPSPLPTNEDRSPVVQRKPLLVPMANKEGYSQLSAKDPKSSERPRAMMRGDMLVSNSEGIEDQPVKPHRERPEAKEMDDMKQKGSLGQMMAENDDRRNLRVRFAPTPTELSSDDGSAGESFKTTDTAQDTSPREASTETSRDKSSRRGSIKPPGQAHMSVERSPERSPHRSQRRGRSYTPMKPKSDFAEDLFFPIIRLSTIAENAAEKLDRFMSFDSQDDDYYSDSDASDDSN